jgi:hypothetical protein
MPPELGGLFANILAGLGIDLWFARTDATTTRHFPTDPFEVRVALADGLERFKPIPTGLWQDNHERGRYESIRLHGREDDGTGLHNYRAATSSVTQRFTSEDLICLMEVLMLCLLCRSTRDRIYGSISLKPGDRFGQALARREVVLVRAVAGWRWRGWRWRGWRGGGVAAAVVAAVVVSAGGDRWHNDDRFSRLGIGNGKGDVKTVGMNWTRGGVEQRERSAIKENGIERNDT